MATQFSQTQPSQYIQDLLTREGSGLFPQLSSSLESPYQQYGGARVAGFSADQLAAMQQARDAVGATNPQEQQAGDLMAQSQQALVGGGQQAQSLLDQSVATGSDYLTRALTQSEQMAQQGNPLFGQSQNLINQSAQGPTSAGLQQYMDPFQQSVIDTTMSELNRQNDIAQQGRNANAISAGAFGGGRQAVGEAEAGRNLSDVQARTLAQLNSQNFGQAMNTFQNQQQMQGQAGQALGGLGAQQFGAQQTALSQMMSGGQGLSNLFSNASGQQAGLAGQQAGGLGDLARQQLGLGSFMREQDIADMNNLNAMGQRQQAQQQAGLDIGYQDFLQQRQYEDPRSKVAFMSDIIRGAPSGSQTMSQTYTPPPSPLQTIAGLAPLAAAFI
jgi:hypothetical protein